MAKAVAQTNCGIFEPPAKPKITKAMKEAMKKSGLSKAEQKAALKEQYDQAKEKYNSDIVLGKSKPDTPQEEIDALKANWEQKKLDYNTRKKEIDAECKKSIAEAKQTNDLSAQKLAIQLAKNKQHNAILDLKEEVRVAREAYYKAALSSDEIYRIHKKAKTRAAIWRDKNLYLMLVPWFVLVMVFTYAPMYGVLIAFKDYSPFKGVLGSPWADMYGFENFYLFFTGPYFFRLLRNTLLINIYSIIWSFPLPIIFALMLNECRNKMFATTIQTISYLPHFVSSVVVAGIVVNFLSPSTGIINLFYKWITGSEQGIYFLAKPEYFRTIYITMGAWQGTGFGSILYSSALAGIDQELYEAARIDGAGRWRQMFNITLPGILPTIAIMLITRMGSILSVGSETIILLYQPITYETADVISTYVYRIGLISAQYSLSTAVGLFNALIAIVMVWSSNTISRKVGEVGLW